MYALRLLLFTISSCCLFHPSHNLTTTPKVSFITGANGYLGREIVHTLLNSDDTSSSSSKSPIFCLVRTSRISDEKNYWKSLHLPDDDKNRINVVPYDMLDGGKSLSHVFKHAAYKHPDVSSWDVHHTASVFKPTADYDRTALDNVRGTEDLFRALASATTTTPPHVVFTSSMAAVRATNQKPGYAPYYTSRDWNTVSQRGVNWGQSYQWSKAASEKRARELLKECGIGMTSICPSFVFGPVRTSSSSYSISLVKEWMEGKSPVQSRLCGDVRDVAAAHVAAGEKGGAGGKRYIVSSERRLGSAAAADVLRRVVGEIKGEKEGEKIKADLDFDGGAIPIGEKEVECEGPLKEDLGVVCRSVEATLEDMARGLLLG